VLALVKAEIQPHAAQQDGQTLQAIAAKQEAEAWEETQDNIAAEWQQKSNAPDKRVKHEGQISDLQKPKAQA